MHVLKKILFVIAIMAIALPSTSWAAEDVKFSGFLDDYSGFAPHPERTGTFVYTAPGFHPRNYSSFIFEPIEIWIDPASEYKGVQPDQLKKITDSFREAITKELEDAYPIVDKPGPGVAIVRLALTNVYLKKKKWKVYNYTPWGAAAKGVEKAAGKNIALAAAHFEAEVVDSRSGQRLRAGVDTLAGEKMRKRIEKQKKNPETTWGDIEDTLVFYAKRFRKQMDKARGK